MACGVSPDYEHCALSCDLSTNGGSFGTLSGLLDYCTSAVGVADKNCVINYLSCTNLGYPPGSSSVSISSSSSSVCSSSEFNWDIVSAGFVEAFPVFATIFGVWCIVKLFRMIWWGAK